MSQINKNASLLNIEPMMMKIELTLFVFYYVINEYNNIIFAIYIYICYNIVYTLRFLIQAIFRGEKI